MKHLVNALGGGMTPQTEQARADQVLNDAGGFVFQLDCFARLARFLVIGSEGGTYYVREQKLTKDNLVNVQACIVADGRKTVDMIVDISDRGAAAKNDYAIFALALACSTGDETTRKYAFSKLNQVCRIGTHLFQFVEFISKMRGWGRMLTNAIGNWYLSKTPSQLAYQVVKYQSRAIEGQPAWSHDDVLRKCHAHAPEGSDIQQVFRWITEGWSVDGQGNATTSFIKNHSEQGPKVPGVREQYSFKVSNDLRIIEGYELAKHEQDPKKVAKLIQSYGLTQEMIPTHAKTSPIVWEALLEKMPLTAMIRNLGNMSKVGILGPLSSNAMKVRETLLNIDNLKKARIHPLNVLNAKVTYASGRSFKGDGTWEVNQVVNAALEDAFYLSFGAIEPTNKRFSIGQDVSGSMTMASQVNGLSCAQISAVMSMVTVRTEPYLFYGGFQAQFVDLKINKNMSLDEVTRRISNMTFGSTDASVAIRHATDNKMPVDVFAIYTDNDTYAGKIHPFEALKQYRQKMGINSKLVVVGMTSTGFTIADPKDAGMLDVVGFDIGTPNVISSFAR